MKNSGTKGLLDFLFISGPLGLHITGGDNVMLNLAQKLKDDGYKVGILYVAKVEKYFEENSNDYSLYQTYIDCLTVKYKVFSIVFHNKLGMKLLWIKRKIKGELENIPTLKGIKISFQRIPDYISSRRTIAVGWRSAYVLEKISYEGIKYYLVQHDEDDKSYSGNLFELAAKSYTFNFKKIIYNHHLSQRFFNDAPIKIKLGLTWLPQKNILPEQKMRGTILLVLRNGNSKGSEFALKAALELSENKGISFRSFGDYSGEIPKFIEHYGWANKETLSNLYNWASIFVIPSIIEGFSLTTAEAMYAGCAIVASDCIGVREIVKHELNGFVVSPKNPRIIANKISELVNNDELRLSFANAAMRDILNYTFDNTYREFINGILEFEKSVHKPLKQK